MVNREDKILKLVHELEDARLSGDTIEVHVLQNGGGLTQEE